MPTLDPSQQTVGCDLGDRTSHMCVLDTHGDVTERAEVPTNRAAFEEWFSKRPACRVALEACTHSRWVSQTLRKLGHEVVVANPRQIALIYKSRKKNDPEDAERLARLARMDPTLLSPIEHRSEAAQMGLGVLKVREALVRMRTRTVNQIRASVKAFGHRIPTMSAEGFHNNAPEHVPPELGAIVAPLFAVLTSLAEQIAVSDKKVRALCKLHPDTQRLRQISGVGDVTSLAFVLTIESPDKFAESRNVPAYLGLVPAQDKSCTIDRQLPITKAGDRLMRTLLVQSANYLLGPFGPDTDLKRWGLKLMERGGKAARKRAKVAVARKLSVILHRLWLTKATYVPLGFHVPAKAA